MSKFVADSSAVLAVIQQESGADDVIRLVADDGWAISTVNLAEVASKLTDRGTSSDEAHEIISGLDLDVHSFEEGDAMESAALRNATRSAGLSLGDRACIALAQSLELPVITMDRAWTTLRLPVEVRLARPATP